MVFSDHSQVHIRLGEKNMSGFSEATRQGSMLRREDVGIDGLAAWIRVAVKWDVLRYSHLALRSLPAHSCEQAVPL
jgi:hypothetical protein